MQHYQEIKSILEAIPRTSYKYKDLNKYLGSPSTILSLSTKDRSLAIKKWYLSNKYLSTKDITVLIDSLIKSDIYEEKVSGMHLLELYSEYRKTFPIKKLAEWLESLNGWAEIDIMCQSNFSADEILARWEEWEKLLTSFNNSNNISKRRASLVLLCRASKETNSIAIKEMALNNIRNLMHEKDILITKAVSWLLRSMIKNYREDVVKFLEDTNECLPKIAIREVTNKLNTGKK